MGYSQRNRHGKIRTGRLVVGAACLLVLIANTVVFRMAAARPHPVPPLEVVALISLLWIFSGAFGMIIRKDWGRYIALGVLYAGALASFLTILTILIGPKEGALAGRLTPFIIATLIYTTVSIVLTRSKHVRRLTSRAWE